MLLNGFILGLLTFIGWATVWHKLPVNVQEWTAKHSFLIDFITTVATYLALGSTLVALFAAAWVGLFFEAYMYVRRNPQDFDWLYDMIDRVKLYLRKLGQLIRQKNEEYKANKLANQPVVAA